MSNEYENRFAELVQEALLEMPELVDDITSIRTFAEAGVMTNNAGLVVALSDGRKFQLTIVEA